MNASDLVNLFRNNSIELNVVDDKIKFKAPRGFMTEELLDSLKTNKDEIIALLKSDGNQQAIPQRPANAPIPLSFAQQRLWFLDQFEPGSAFYNIPAAARLVGQLDETALRCALNEIVRRHEALRTSFAMLDGTPVQVIAEQFELILPVTDLTELPAAEREAYAQQLAQGEAQIVFDLSTGPLIRAGLIRLDVTDHILLFTMHHIITDGWSMGILVKEVAALYAAYSQNKPPALPELPIQYADFAHWQRQWLSGDVLRQQLDYWAGQLNGSPILLTLPTDRPRPVMESHQGAILPFEVSAATTARLRALNKQTQTTLFMTLTAAFNILLARYAGQSDICIGTPIANRNRAEIEPLIGFFINTLVLRTQIDSAASFDSLLRQVRATTLGAYAHQDVPFEQLVDTLKPERHTSHSPLFQVMLVLQNAPIGDLSLPGLTLRPIKTESVTAKFDLTLDILETEGQLLASFEYNTDLFDQSTIERMAGHFTHLLEAIVANPGARIQDLPMLGEDERHQLLVEWNATETDYPKDKCIHQLFETQVEKTPEAVAVVFDPNPESAGTGTPGVGDQQLTYAELNARANQLAHSLQKLGVGPDVLVGICVERSLEMVIGLYAILKAGGAYVPLDPTYPQDRLAYMLKDAQVSVLLTQAHLLRQIPAHSAQTICLDRDWQSLIASQPTHPPASQTTADHLAYMIYTSGSTGKPKGAMNAHRGICNRLLWMQDAYPLTDSDRVLQKTPFSFDVSVWEFFWPLITGARLVVARPEGHKDSAYLADLIVQAQITTLHFVPSMLQVFLDQPNLARCQSLKRVICSGEALPYELQKKFFERLNAELHNLYGPTEAAVDVTYWACQKDSPRQIVPIGFPIANTQLYILDANLQPVPIGVPGELHIGGIGVGRGYHNRPELTAEKFIPNPFAINDGGRWTVDRDHRPPSTVNRLYRTSDLARYLPDGSIEYLGRLDFQVKIRGFRIELGEIEAVLNQYPTVQTTVVIARDDIPGDPLAGAGKRLVAYLVSNIATDRVPFEGSCQVEEHDGDVRSVTLEDISCNGACLGNVPDRWEVGQIFYINVSLLPTLMAQRLPAEVIWKKDNRVGILFETSSAEREVLRQNIAHLRKTKDYTVMDLRRLSHRVPLDEAGLVRWDDDQVLEISTVDVSWSGACIKGLPDLDKHQGKLLRLKLPFGSDGVWLDGKLIWQRDEYAGVRFIETTSDVQALLHKTIGEILIGGNPSIAQLNAYLRERLPHYMVPSAFIFLDALPLNPNGKVDRRALPAPDMTRSEAGYVAPRTPTEETLARIWADVLKLDKVGIHDNFFELGGHSLLVITLIERMRQAGFSADIRALFTTPTIAELATTAQTGSNEIEIPPNRIPADCQVITPDMLPLVQLTADEIAQIARTVPGGAGNIQDIYPLTPLQEGILFHHLISQVGDAYLLSSLIGFESRERLEFFVNALQVVITRHDILRTAVVWDGLSQPVQVVWRQAPVAIKEIDINPEEGDIAQQLSDRYDPRHTRLDIREAPMLRGFIAEDRANDRWLLQIIFHHLAGDHTTLELVVAEIQTILQGREVDLPVTFPFRNFVAQARLGIPQAEHEAFFSAMLSHVDEPTTPFGLLDVQGDGSGIEEARQRVDPELARRLRQQARRLKVSAASLMHLAYAQVLARTTGRQDVVFGTVLFGRMHGGTGADRVMGMFINTLPICIPVGGMSVQESVHQTHARLTELLRYEHASLTLAQRCSGVRTPTPLFSALLNYRYSQDAETTAQTWEGMQVLSGEERTNYPVTLSVDDLGEGFTLTAQVVANVKAQRICDYMHTALEHLADALETAPQTAANQIEVLPMAELHQLLVEWNATETEYPKDKCIHQLFEAQVEKTPEAVAVVFDPNTPGAGDKKLTYAELNARANQLAHYLLSQGVGPDVLVGICVERSVEMIVGLLGILKAGGAYVPLDPSYPKDRLAYILNDAKPTVLLTQTCLREHLPSENTRLLCLDADWPIIAQESSANTVSSMTLDDPFYVIYTSGSTGLPKGSVVRQRGFVNLLDWFVREFELSEKDRVLLISSFSFDLTQKNLFAPLIVGGQLHLQAFEHYDALAIVQDVCRRGITWLNCTPSAFYPLVNYADESLRMKDSLRYVFLGGEPIVPLYFSAWLNTEGSKTQIVNTYGPTECTDISNFYRLDSIMQNPESGVPVGRPITNSQIYLLDALLNPVPVGVAGELYIAGVSLAYGYLNRPDLTAEKFVPNPFRSIPGARMYRSGDLARYLPGGSIEYLGRLDFQVKIRGFRIELGEIEAVLAALPEVRETVVVARDIVQDRLEDIPNNKRLVAYLVPQAGYTLPETAALRSELAQSLPEYMIPAHFISLDALPLSPNGKVDRRALPAPDMTRSESGYIAPRTHTEETLARIWADVLKLDRVGTRDNFFELGGHSLLAITLIERMRQVGFSADIRALFTTPTIAALAAAVQAGGNEVDAPPNRIPSDCQSITSDMLPLIQLTADEIAQIVKTVPGGAANIQDIYPLAPLQEGILFHHLMNQEGDAYLLVSLLSFDSRERLERFVSALQVVIHRHDILRTAAVWDGLAQPVQVVWRQAPVTIETVSFDANDGDIAQQLSDHFDPRHYRLDIRQAPMLRGFIAEDRPNQRWLLNILTHHLVTDHTTLELLIAEIQTILQGRQADLPVTFPFRNFVAQARLGISQAEHEAFFTEMLSHVDEPTAPFGLLDVQGDGSGIEEAHQTLDPQLASRLRQQARRLGVSAASLMHLAWAQVLARTTGRQDVVFGTVFFGRMQGGAGADRVMGMFINTLPICIPVGSISAEESVRQTHARLMELLRHEHASLALAQRCSGVHAPAPLFSALLNYRHSTETQTPDQTWDGMQLLSGEERTNYPVALSVDDLGEGFTLTAQVVASVQAQRICDYMQTALEHLADALETAPQTAIHQIEVLPLAERHQLLVEWNATETEYPKDKCLQQLFEAQVEKTPDAVAVVFDPNPESAGTGTPGASDQQLTYAELNARANQLAHSLQKLGVGPDVLVGICMERSLEMVIGLYAILKAGGAYVPLDPTYPQDRLAYMLKDAQVSVLLTQAHLLHQIPAHSAQTICLDSDWQSLIASQPTHSPISHVTADHLAYMIYTSGSTGKPKGAMNAHRGICNRLLWMQDAYPLTDSDRVLQKTPFSFDVSVWEFFWPLITGARLVVARPEGHKDSAYLADLIVQAQITTLHFVPSMLQVFLDQPNLARCQSLKRVICSGEALPYELQKKFFERLSAELHNLYGPTEAAVDVTYWACQKDSPLQIVPIGFPIANTQLYILDANLQPVPIGVPGELHIGGIGVGRGYHNRPELTAEKFIPNPFAINDGGRLTVDRDHRPPSTVHRLYRTSDLARYLPDGSIEYLGRLDFQVKIRGFRIELGEIEAVLAALPEVREVVVVAREDQAGGLADKRLVAYLVPQTGHTLPETAALRSELAQSLPEYMIPAHFISLNALPLSPNGKVDRRALPAPNMTRSESGYIAPRTQTEETLAQIWTDVLKLDRVGTRDNFFELGGHSLLAITLIERMRQVGFSADIRALFTTPTIAALAAAVQAGGNEVEAPPNRIPADCQFITPNMLPLVQLTADEIAQIAKTVPGGAANIQDIYPLAPLQEGILFHHLMNQEGDAYLLVSLLSFDSRERLERFVNALQVVIHRHDILRTAAVWDGLSQPVQVVWRKAPVVVEEIDMNPEDGDIARQLSDHFDPRHTRLDIRQAPMLRGFIAEDRPNQRWLLNILTHHLATDHTTLELLIAEIQTILQGRQEDLPITFPFRNFVAQARLGISQAEHEAFFSEMLSHVDEPTAPFGLLDVQGDGSGIEEARQTVDPQLARRLRQQARRLGVSAASLIHLAWAQVLARTTGRQDVVFGTVFFGRMQGGAGADRVMGMFINTLPICIQVGEMNVQESVRQTHARLMELLRHEHASLALAQRCSGVHAPAPLFSSLLNYRHSTETEPTDQTWDGMQLLSGEERTNYPVALSVDDLGDGFTLTAQVVASVQAQRICDYMQTALEHLADALETAPQTAIHQIEVLPLAERHQLLVEWNATETEYPKDKCIHQLFEAQVEKTPEAVAVVFDPNPESAGTGTPGAGDQKLTYAELNARANQLAHSLQKLGVGPDVLVGICVERSLEMMVGLLGILKAGGAYLPLDPTYPKERLAYMLKDAQVSVLLTQAALRNELPAHHAQLICLDTEWAQIALAPRTNPTSHSTPENLAYVIYTSGSTGRPKGAMVLHSGLVNYLIWCKQAYPLNSGQGAPVHSSISFDLTITGLFAPLIVGRPVHMLAENFSTETLAASLKNADRDFSLIKITPAHLQLLGEQLALEQINRCTGAFIIGGENLQPSHINFWRANAPDTLLINEYGPTETVVGCCVYIVPSDKTLSGTLPIGKPINNTCLYILDSNLNPVPVGVSGELYIGGSGVARGYLNRPDVTAEKFIPNPFSSIPGARMYKSGDLARYMPDGNIECLGRMDSQVKIRGFRIELGEIEAVLAALPEVREVAVLARDIVQARLEDIPNDKRLVAYLVPEAGCNLPETAALRSELAQSLPEYMIPTHFISLEQLPLTPNGKVDRKALPAPDMTRSETGYIAPRTPTEETLARIWADVLKLDKVGVHDNFFELGGHSLLAISLIERMRQVGFSADIRALFTTPTIAALATAVQAGGNEVEAPPNRIPTDCQAITPDMLSLVQLSADEISQIVNTVPGGAANIQDIYPLAPLQEGILFHHLMNQEGDAYLLPSVVSFDSRERLEHFISALQIVINRHDILRTAVVWGGLAQPIQVVWRQAPVVVEEIDMNPDDGDIARQLSDRYDPRHTKLDIRQAPMLHGFMAEDRANHRWLLNILAHHLVTDHTTLELLIAEIHTILQGREEDLPVTFPFRNFVAQARLGISQAEHEAFFSEMLSHVDEPTAPFGLLDVQGDGSGIEEARQRVDPQLARRLRQQARRLGVSAASLIHLAWAQVLARTTGRQEVVFGTVLFGRMQGGAGADRVMGMFINTLPICIPVGGMGVQESVRQTHAHLTELLRHEHASLALAQRCSGVHAPTPLFSVILNYRYSAEAETIDQAWDGIQALSGEERTNYPIALAVDDLGEGFMLTVQVIASVKAQRICDYVQTTLEHLADALETAPQTAVNQIEVLPLAEREQLLLEWNATETAYPPAARKCIHELFEAQVQKTPDAVAIVFDPNTPGAGDEKLTYAELNARANQLAHSLLSQGVGPDVLVGICVERSLEMIVGLLGILKAGGAYLPLDPAYPKERLVYMLQDAKPAILLTQQHLQQTLPIAGFCLDSQWDSLGNYPITNPKNITLPGNLAYVIYTSGSTGKPKGVLLTHHGLTNLVHAQVNAFSVHNQQRILQFASFNFDASTSEIFMALASGATLCLATHDDILPGKNLETTLERLAINVVTLPPVALNMVSAALPNLETLIVAGEACPANLVTQWAGNHHFFNAYGPTEFTVCASIQRCQMDQAGPPPIGRPIANTQIYLLDTNLQPVPVGVAGELYIAGDGLARGYQNQPGMTAEKFIPNPFIKDSGRWTVDDADGYGLRSIVNNRLYRTGDLARYLPNGSIEYLGRIDSQVKMRGFRIELGEIEAALASLPEVREVTVLARNIAQSRLKDTPGDKSIVAYIAPVAEKKLELWPSVAEYYIYDELLYLAMTTDTRRNNSYKVALEHLAKEKVVLEIGTGPDAILARFAVEKGAHKVYAIELLEETYLKAKATIARLGLQDKIILIHGDATKVKLPEKVDIVLSEIVGAIGGSEGSAVILNTAVDFMKDDGLMIPQRSLTKTGAVTLPQKFISEPAFTPLTGGYVEKVFDQVGYQFDLRLCIKGLNYSDLISDTDVFEDLNHVGLVPVEDQHTIHLTIQRDGRLDGVLVWLTLDTMPGETIDILANEHCWLPVYLPILYPGIDAKRGETITATITRTLAENGLNPNYRIEGQLNRQDGSQVTFDYDAHHFKPLYQQTPFYEQLFKGDTIPVKQTSQVGLSHKMLRDHLKASLPEYMIPSAFVFLEQLPLTPNGKVDRKALPAPDTARSEAGYMAPRTPTEETLAQIWADVLKLDKVGIHDNFFELGGHSLLAVQLIARIQQTFQRQIPLSVLFQNPTLAQFTRLIAEPTRSVWSPIVPIQPHGSQIPIFCIHPAGGFVGWYTDLAYMLGPDQPFYGIQGRALDNQEPSYVSMEEMAASYCAAIQEVQAQGPYRLAGWSMGGLVAYEMARQLKQRGEEITFLGLFDCEVSFGQPVPSKNSAPINFLRYGRNPIPNIDQIISETDEDVVSKAFVLAKQADKLPHDLSLDDFRKYMETFHLHARAQCAYEPQPYPGTATLFMCYENSMAISIAETQAKIDRWRGLVNDLEFHEIPGDHHNMMFPPHVEHLAARMSVCLGKKLKPPA